MSDKLQRLDDGGVGHAATLAHRLQPVPSAALFKCVDKGCHDASTASAERVADGDGTAVDVGFGQIGAGFSRMNPVPSYQVK